MIATRQAGKLDSTFFPYRNGQIERARWNIYGHPFTQWYAWVDGERSADLETRRACEAYIDTLHGDEHTPEYRTVIAASTDEDNDCAVKAVAIATGTDYETVRRMLAEQGRQPGCGTPRHQTLMVLVLLGYVPESTFTIDRTVRTFARNHPKGRYLVSTSGHICAVVDGHVHDWDKRSLRRIKDVFELVKR